LPGFTSLPTPHPGTGSDRTIIGSDDRKVVTPDVARVFPYCTVCSLLGLTADGRFMSHGTGTLIGLRTVVTARHVVFDADAGGLMQSLTVFPGRAWDPVAQEHIFPFGGLAVGADSIRPHPTLDCAAVFLGREPTDADGHPLGAAMVYSDPPDPDIPVGSAVHTLGYPTFVPTALQSLYPKWEAMFWNAGQVTGLDGEDVRYNFDTTEGQSGSPVFQYFPSRPSQTRFVMVAVHVQGNAVAAFNSGVRMDAALFDQFDSWRRENNDL
jgi:V8-like Glu-specific endopeptidase